MLGALTWETTMDKNEKIDKIKLLREQCGWGIMQCKSILNKYDYDFTKAVAHVMTHEKPKVIGLTTLERT